MNLFSGLRVLLDVKLVVLVFTIFLSGCTSFLPYSWKSTSERVVLLPTAPRLLGDTKDVLISVQVDGRARLVRYNLDSNKAEEIRPPLPREDSFFVGDIFPGEDLLVFSWYRRATRVTEICTMKLDGTDFKTITDDGATNSSPFFSTSGNEIGYLNTTRKGLTKTNFVIYNRRTATSRVVPNSTQILMMSPRFSSDDNSIQFSENYITDLGLNQRIISMDIHTGQSDILLDRQRFLAPVNLTTGEKLVYFGWEMNSLEAENNYKPYRKELQGFFEYDLSSKETKFLAKASSTANSFSTSREKNLVMYQYIERVNIFDLTSRSEQPFELDKNNILKATEARNL